MAAFPGRATYLLRYWLTGEPIGPNLYADTAIALQAVSASSASQKWAARPVNQQPVNKERYRRTDRPVTGWRCARTPAGPAGTAIHLAFRPKSGRQLSSDAAPLLGSNRRWLRRQTPVRRT